MERDAENGMLVGPSGCHYPNEHQAYHYDLLGLCGCGNPEGAYNFCRDILEVCDRRDRTKEWVHAEDVIAKIIAKDTEMAAHVLMHLLTDRGLLEHGGGVGGSWLTDAGEKIVDLGPATEELMDES